MGDVLRYPITRKRPRPCPSAYAMRDALPENVVVLRPSPRHRPSDDLSRTPALVMAGIVLSAVCAAERSRGELSIREALGEISRRLVARYPGDELTTALTDYAADRALAGTLAGFDAWRAAEDKRAAKRKGRKRKAPETNR